jgi:hypothetical protein
MAKTGLETSERVVAMGVEAAAKGEIARAPSARKVQRCRQPRKEEFAISYS